MVTVGNEWHSVQQLIECKLHRGASIKYVRTEGEGGGSQKAGYVVRGRGVQPRRTFAFYALVRAAPSSVVARKVEVCEEFSNIVKNAAGERKRETQVG